jgi:uncharacterized membrane protein HdeD (DUF308 family)
MGRPFVISLQFPNIFSIPKTTHVSVCPMNKTILIGLVLITLGVLALGYEGMTYMTHEEVIDLGPLEINVEKKETIPVPRIVGVVFLLGGIATVAYAAKKPSR